MLKKRFRESLERGKKFVIIAELTGGPNFSFEPIRKFLTAHKESGGKKIPSCFDFVGVSNPQSPGGVANIEPADVHRFIREEQLLGELDFVPHVSCKDSNSDGIVSLLNAHKASGVESILALTGDKPVTAQKVFELESVGLISLMVKMNNNSIMKAKNLDKVKNFFIGAAVSQYKYSEASQVQQYYKMLKKIACGADFLITQVGWDWKKCVELMRFMKDEANDTPVIGNVYMLSTITPAPRLMHDIKLPGCFVSDELLKKIYSESVDDHIERTAQQIAMYKSIGTVGVDLGGVRDYDMFIKILSRAAEIGDGWEEFKDNLCWPKENGFYLYDDSGKQNPPSKFRKTFSHHFFNFMHFAILDSNHFGFGVFKNIMKFLGTEKQKGFFYKGFNATEKAFKYCAFDCQECGDCYLPENFGLCTIGGCEKGMDNAPCGDSTADGRCGNNLDRICIGEYIYKVAAAEKGGLAKLKTIINKPRMPELMHTASVLNHLFGKDHTLKSPLIGIAELVHASIPKTGAVMTELHSLGETAFTKTSGPLDYIKALIESQAAEGAAYIAVNVDEFGESDPAWAVSLMREYVKLVRKWGQGVPVCIDSSDDNVLVAGLEEWYDCSEKIEAPLLNSIKVHTIDKIMPLKKSFDFKFIGMLIGEGTETQAESVEDLYGLAKTICLAATEKYGFKAEEIFFDSTVFPLAIDMPMQPGAKSYTYRTFNTIKKIKTDDLLKNCHFSLGVTNSVRDLPGRKIGVARAYVEVAMRYGLDAGIVNVSHQFGVKPAAPELVKLVEAFADMDGSDEKMNEAMVLMGQFCSTNRKPAK
ncbi:MAG: methylenetetrahydrofolate reductase C-terminal domain-containing protein [Anaerohalosphaeraceae bacterium]|nr:methylenetetrahydrofolate reductase C-terminal domain-containing protein [Anaerohalosphaeraceae bacterium]